VVVIRVGGERTFLLLCVVFEVVDFDVHLADELRDGLVGDGIKFLRNVLSVDLSHHLSDETLGFLHLFLAIVDLPLLLLFLAYFVDVLEFLVELVHFLRPGANLHLFLELLDIFLRWVGVLSWEDADVFLGLCGLLGVDGVGGGLVLLVLDGEESGKLLLLVKVHLSTD
jgi:hypothetical protein